jgi:hypothetical protein
MVFNLNQPLHVSDTENKSKKSRASNPKNQKGLDK